MSNVTTDEIVELEAAQFSSTASQITLTFDALELSDGIYRLEIRPVTEDVATVSLSSDIGPTDTLITVSDVGDLPAEGSFRIRIDDEIMLVTNVFENDLTVVRGIELSDAAAHIAGTDTVYHRVVDGVLDDFGNVMYAFAIEGDTQNRLFQYIGDFNGDGSVTVFDFAGLAYWFSLNVDPTDGAPDYMDLNNDGGVSIFDFPLFRDQFASGLPLISPPSANDDVGVVLADGNSDFAIDVLANDDGVTPDWRIVDVQPLATGDNPNNPLADIWINPDGRTVGYQADDLGPRPTSGTDAFTYTVSDGAGRLDTAIVTLAAFTPRAELGNDWVRDRPDQERLAALDQVFGDELDDLFGESRLK